MRMCVFPAQGNSRQTHRPGVGFLPDPLFLVFLPRPRFICVGVFPRKQKRCQSGVPTSLVVGVGGEDLALLGWDGGVALDQLRHDAPDCLDSEQASLFEMVVGNHEKTRGWKILAFREVIWVNKYKGYIKRFGRLLGEPKKESTQQVPINTP